MKSFLTGWIFVAALAGGDWQLPRCMALQTGQVDGYDESSSEASREIDAILKSDRWAKAQQQFDQWLSLQNAYDKNETEALKSELRSRVAMMSATQLDAFLAEMEARLAVLLSPEAVDARRWVAPLTDQALQRLRAKYGVVDPMRMSAIDLDIALQQFAADRQTQAAGAAAFNQSRETAADSAIRLQQSQQKSLDRATQRSSGTFQTLSSPYAPRSQRPTARTFSSPYPKLNYSVGPWGGVWISPRQ